jgi:hypothetical protein
MAHVLVVLAGACADQASKAARTTSNSWTAAGGLEL